MSVPRGVVVEDREVGRRAARGFMDRSGCVGSGNSVAPESTRHVTAFCHSRLGNTRCYCMAQKRRVIAVGLSGGRLTRRGCSVNPVINSTKNHVTANRGIIHLSLVPSFPQDYGDLA